MKILYVTTVGLTMGFFKSFIRELLDAGHIVDIATNEDEHKVADCYREWGCRIHQINTSRSSLNKKNLKVIKEIKKITQENEYDIVHCHTPVAAFLTRIACRSLRKQGTKVFYTAHGFHFYKGAPLLNWLVYYPVEKVCAQLTDLLITINKEDYALAQKEFKKAGKISYVQGVGIDVERFARTDNTLEKANDFRKKLNLPDEDFLIISIGELNDNKNHQVVLNALSHLKNEHIHYAIAGIGDKHDHLIELAESLGLKDRFHLLGYVNDIPSLCHGANLFCFPSIREGLPVSVMEAMAAGLPLIVADARGSRDCCVNGVNGIICSPFSEEDFASAIETIINSPSLREAFSQQNIIDSKTYDISIVNESMKQLYFG